MDEEFEKAQKSHCLWNKRQKRHENGIVYGQSASRLIKFLSSLDNCIFIGYIFDCWQTNQRKCCFKHCGHGQFKFQQFKLALFMDDSLSPLSTEKQLLICQFDYDYCRAYVIASGINNAFNQ